MCFPIIAISRKDGGFVLKMGCKGADRLQKVDFWHFFYVRRVQFRLFFT